MKYLIKIVLVLSLSFAGQARANVDFYSNAIPYGNYLKPKKVAKRVAYAASRNNWRFERKGKAYRVYLPDYRGYDVETLITIDNQEVKINLVSVCEEGECDKKSKSVEGWLNNLHHNIAYEITRGISAELERRMYLSENQ